MTLHPVADELLFRDSAADDPRLGSLVKTGTLDDARSLKPTVALIGLPDDRGIVAGSGRAGAAAGPTALRRIFYKMTLGDHDELRGCVLFDAGDVALAPTVEETHAHAETAVSELLSTGARVVLLGGGHDGAYASQAALLASLPPEARGSVVNVDAHLDVRPLKDGTIITSGTAFRRLADRFGARLKLVELASQPQVTASAHRWFLEQRGDVVQSLPELRTHAHGVGAAMRSALSAAAWATTVGVSLCLDSVRAADAPGVSAPQPDGLSAAEFLEVAQAAGEHRQVRVLDVVELSPPFDHDGRTARLAALAVWRFCAATVR